MGRRSLILPLLPLLANLAAANDSGVATYDCDATTLGTFYPFCVHIPPGAKQAEAPKMPLLIYLPGSTTKHDRPSIDDLKTWTSYDGVGKLLADYRSGNTSDVVQFVANNFITVIPISPLTNPNNASQQILHYWPDRVDALLHHALINYPTDNRKVYISGYSMGSRGAWRYITAYPGRAVASIHDAGGAEPADGVNMVPQDGFTYGPTFNMLNKVTNNNIMAWDGTYDDVAGTAIPRATQAELERLGSKSSQLLEFPCDHIAMQRAPWIKEVFQWLLSHQGPAQRSRRGKLRQQRD